MLGEAARPFASRARARRSRPSTAAGPPTAHYKQHSFPSTPFASTHGRQLSFNEVLSFELRFPPNEIPRANSHAFSSNATYRLWEKVGFFCLCFSTSRQSIYQQHVVCMRTRLG